jgi:hypothetical protein
MAAHKQHQSLTFRTDPARLAQVEAGASAEILSAVCFGA